MLKPLAWPLIYRASVTLCLVISIIALPAVGKFRPDVAPAQGTRARTDSPSVSRGSGNIETETQRRTAFRHLPLRFEVNAGQSDPEVKFIARDQSGVVFLTRQETVLRLYG